MNFREHYLDEAFGEVTEVRGYYDGPTLEKGGTRIKMAR